MGYLFRAFLILADLVALVDLGCAAGKTVRCFRLRTLESAKRLGQSQYAKILGRLRGSRNVTYNYG